METLAEPVVGQSEKSWELRGKAVPAKPTILYRAGLLAVTAMMVLLPLLYIGLIGATAYGVYQYAIHGVVVLDRGGGGTSGRLIMYLGPLVIGALVVVFMVKPFFAARPKRQLPRTLERDDAPQLFALIHQICDAVHAPRPSKVAVDMQVNASASFRNGFWSLFRNDLVLTIGLPLVSGLTVRQFAGVLAHEFGHFAQGAGMRLTFVIRSINGWFSRVVYERDALDEGLTEAANRLDFRISIVLQLARLMIWLTRKILWVFMIVGHAISCFMLRQMEFDADYYETQVSGSDGFAETSLQLQLLNIGWQKVLGQQQEAFETRRLANDLPRLLAFETGRFPSDLREAVRTATQEGKTGWFDTHPADVDRIRAAVALSAPGLLESSEPAMSLFPNMEALGQEETKSFYREQCGIDLSKVSFLPLENVMAQALAEEAAWKCLKEYGGKLNGMNYLVAPSGTVDLPLADAPARLEELREFLTTLLPAAEKSEETIGQADERIVHAMRARALLAAGYGIAKKDFGLPSGDAAGVDEALASAREEIAKALEDSAPAREASLERFNLALALALNNAPAAVADEPDDPREIRELIRVAQCFGDCSKTLLALRNDVTGLGCILMQQGEAPAGWARATQDLARSIESEVKYILGRCEGIRYPFEHADGAIPLGTFLTQSDGHEHEVVRSFFRGRAVVDHAVQLHHRVLCRLATSARRAEERLLPAPVLASA